MPRAVNFKRQPARADAYLERDDGGDDTDADKPKQVHRGIGQWPSARGAAAPGSSVFAAGQAAKRKRAAPVVFDPDAIPIEKAIPIPPPKTASGAAGRYRRLLERLAPGDSVSLPPTVARGLVSCAKKAGRKVIVRAGADDTARVWLVE